MKVARIYLRVMSFSEDDCTEYQESAALVDCSAVYRAVLLTLSRVAASRTLSPLAMCSRARCNLSAVTTGFRPPFLPRAAAAVNPALVRSRIKSRSNWPSAPNTWKMSRPPGVVVSMASVRERKPTPRASSAPIVSNKVRHRAPEPIQPPDGQHVAVAQVGQRIRQAGAVGLGPGSRVLENALAACLA